MADQCIVCLGDLRTIVAADTPPEPAAAQARERGADSAQHTSLRNTKLSAKRYTLHTAPEPIEHIRI